MYVIMDKSGNYFKSRFGSHLVISLQDAYVYPILSIAKSCCIGAGNRVFEVILSLGEEVK